MELKISRRNTKKICHLFTTFLQFNSILQQDVFVEYTRHRLEIIKHASAHVLKIKQNA